jgi:hypothetical protein
VPRAAVFHPCSMVGRPVQRDQPPRPSKYRSNSTLPARVDRLQRHVPADPTDVPWAVAARRAAQLVIADPGVLKQYAGREGTNRLHAGEIKRAYGYRDFADPAVQQDLAGACNC